MEGCQGEGRTGEWGDKEGEKGTRKRGGEGEVRPRRENR